MASDDTKTDIKAELKEMAADIGGLNATLMRHNEITPLYSAVNKLELDGAYREGRIKTVEFQMKTFEKKMDDFGVDMKAMNSTMGVFVEKVGSTIDKLRVKFWSSVFSLAILGIVGLFALWRFTTDLQAGFSTMQTDILSKYDKIITIQTKDKEDHR